MREIKFRAWMDEAKYMVFFDLFNKPSNVFSSDPIMQYTGLKDKNGREIYEGDIVRDNELGLNGEVEWNYSHLLLLERNLSREKSIEVIGNIYENPELLQ